MLCKRPYVKTPIGVRAQDVVLSSSARLAATPFPCGQCLHCRINSARERANRLLLEQMVHDESSFLTLTYDEENVNAYGDLVKDDLQKWIKRFRYYFGRFRYFAVGEYGEQTWRPHYHVAAFGVPIDCQKVLEKSWTQGQVHVGELNKDSASYITGYIVKGLRDKGYWKLRGLEPEFALASNKPGIGGPAIDIMAEKVKKFSLDIRQNFNALNFGKKRSVPIGRYLADRFNRKCNTSDSTKDMAFYEYQKEIFDKHLDGNNHYDNLLDENSDMRKARERRHQIFKGRRSI